MIGQFARSQLMKISPVSVGQMEITPLGVDPDPVHTPPFRESIAL